MIEIATTSYFKTASLETKSTGLSTVNYVDTNKSHKKYIKVVASTSSKRLTFESYLYEKVLAYTARKLHRPSLLSVRELSIQVELGQSSKGLVSYYIERPFVEYSLKQIFQSSFRLQQSMMPQLIKQLLKMFIENAGEETAVVCPANILVNKTWNGQIQMFGNYTSLGSFHLLLEGEGILVQKFKELYCYMHPKIFDWESRKINLDFKAKLYSFALNLFSLIFNKEICYPLYCNRDQMTITINQAKKYMERSNANIKKSFGSKIVKEQLQNIEDKVKGLGMGLFKFFSEVFLKEESCKYTSWVGIIGLFQPEYFKEYEAQTQEGTFRAIKIIYDSQDEEKKEHYEKMGVIWRDCSVAKSKQELILYMLTKYEKFNVMAFQPGSSPSSKVYNPDLYIFNKRVELEALEINQKMKKSTPEMEKDEEYLDCFDLREEARFSRQCNIVKSEIVGKWDVSRGRMMEIQKERPQGRIFIANEYQKTLNSYESNLWL